MKLLSYVFFFLYGISKAYGQIEVSNISSVEDAVNQLAGEGVIFSNVTYSFTGGGKPVGVFKDDFGILGVKSGLVMTTGSATNASGPNDNNCKTTVNKNEAVNSPELEPLVSKPIYDMVTVEFDIQVASNLLEFNYVFGSDEYLEFVDGLYYDVFGFFISGPGINGVQNLAVLPNTQTAVSVGTINSKVNSNYYVNNGTGTTPLVNIDVQYDGFTKPLQAKINVIPCKVYHIKLIIADVNDQTCDSGVFLENNSFTSKNIPQLDVTYDHPRFPYAIEECNNFNVTVTRGANDKLNLNNPIVYDYRLLGSAIVNEDYVMVNQPIDLTIPANQMSSNYRFNVNQDSKEEGNEELIFLVSSNCPEFPAVTSINIPIKDKYEYKIKDTVFCAGNGVQLNNPPLFQDELTWESSVYLSCVDCTSPIASNTESVRFYYTAKDKESSCETKDSVDVNYQPITADFIIENEDCYTIQDFRFINQSIHGESYTWDFGDGNSSNEKEPIHTFGSFSKTQGAKKYNVNLIVENSTLGCRDTVNKEVNIDQFVFIPNIVTPNGDGKNEKFVINGILGECWILTVYNRYGKLVYKNEKYQNDWNPSSLSDGVYFYGLENNLSSREFKGYITVIR